MLARDEKTLLIQISNYPHLNNYIDLNNQSTITLPEECIIKDVELLITKNNALHILQSPANQSLEQVLHTISILKNHYHYIVIDLEQNTETKIQKTIRNMCDIQLIFTNYENISFQKTTELFQRIPKEIQDKTYCVVNQLPRIQKEERASESLPLHQIIGTIPYAPHEIMYQLTHHEPCLRKKESKIKKHMDLMMKALISLLKTNEIEKQI